jgi:hypothetical protein
MSSLEQQFSKIILVFKVFGIYPITNSTLTRYRIHLFWPIFHILLIVALITLIICCPNRFIYNSVDIITYSSVFVTHLLFLFVTVRSHRSYSVIWNKFLEFDQMMQKSRINFEKYNKVVYKSYMKKFLVALILISGLEISIIASIQKSDVQWILYWSVTIFSKSVLKLIVWQHCMFIDLIKNRNDVISGLLERISALLLSSFKNKRVFTRKLTLAKQMLIINCQVLRKVNEIFGLTVALNMGQYFLDCPVQLFWLWTYITSERDTFQIGLL